MGLAASCSRSSQDLRGLANRGAPGPGHSRAASLDLRHARNSSADLNKLFRNDVGLVFSAGGKLQQKNYVLVLFYYVIFFQQHQAGQIHYVCKLLKPIIIGLW